MTIQWRGSTAMVVLHHVMMHCHGSARPRDDVLPVCTAAAAATAIARMYMRWNAAPGPRHDVSHGLMVAALQGAVPAGESWAHRVL